MANWTGNKIRELRCQMGWSRAEMARRLSLGLSEVQSLETCCDEPAEGLTYQLDRMAADLDAHRRQMQKQPIAEVLLKERSMAQIEDDEVHAVAAAEINSVTSGPDSA